jgi:hypothetical protein
MRFTIRDLLWLTVVVALGAFAWKTQRSVDGERAKLSAKQEALIAKEREIDAEKRALDRKFLEMVDTTDKLNDQFARSQKSE